MKIKERSNLLYVELSPAENVLTQIEEIIREYRIIEGKINGYGFLNRIEYGVLNQVEPLFLNKNLYEGYITVNNIIGFIFNREFTLNFSAADEKFNIFGGRFISGNVIESFKFVLEIYRTD